MLVVDRIREETQALPFTIFLQAEDSIKLENMSSHHMRETPGLVGILSSVIQCSRTHTETIEY